MVMEVDNKEGKLMGSSRPKHHVGVGGREYPTQIGKSCTQQKPGESERIESGYMSWKGHRGHKDKA